MNNFDTGDSLCDICGCWATRFFMNITPLCDNRVCEQVLVDELNLELDPDYNNNEGAQQ